MKPQVTNYSVVGEAHNASAVSEEDSTTEYFVRSLCERRSPLLEALKEHFTKYYASEVQEMR